MENIKTLANLIELGEKMAKSMLKDKSHKDFGILAHLINNMTEEQAKATLLWKTFFE